MKYFDGETYKPCGILNSLQVKLGGKFVSTESKVIDGPFYYNILLGHMWFYTMATIISTYFHLISFHHKGIIVAISQLTFFTSDSRVTGSVPIVGETLHSYQHVRFGLLKESLLMETFFLPPLSFLKTHL